MLTINVNGADQTVEGSASWESLLFVLRERLGLYGTKNACEQGECGSCSVLVDGEVVCSCLVLARQVEGRQVVTIEGLDADPVAGVVQECMRRAGGVQCGFCTPGFVVAATGILSTDPSATPEALREGLAGNLCRCTGYSKILEAVEAARDSLAGTGSSAEEARQ
jgi:carbon-monoxide dehydrogenase small subunit